jgi:hypothetical protein
MNFAWEQPRCYSLARGGVAGAASWNQERGRGAITVAMNGIPAVFVVKVA